MLDDRKGHNDYSSSIPQMAISINCDLTSISAYKYKFKTGDIHFCTSFKVEVLNVEVLFKVEVCTGYARNPSTYFMLSKKARKTFFLN